MDQYDQALKLIPFNHRDRAFVHRNRAACYMEMKPVQYDVVIHECSLALKAYPRFGSVCFCRARAFEAPGKPCHALQDVQALLHWEPNHQDAVEMAKRLFVAIRNQCKVQQDLQGRPAAPAAARGSPLNRRGPCPPNRPAGPCLPNRPAGGTSKKLFLKKDVQSLKVQRPKTLPTSSSLKLIYDHDIRLAQMSVGCKFSELREAVRKIFPSSKAVLIKYEDIVGDLVTITNTEELRLAEEAASYNTVKAAIRKLQATDSIDSLVAEDVEIASFHKKQGSSTSTFNGWSPLRLHVVEVSPEQEPTVQEGDALRETNTEVINQRLFLKEKKERQIARYLSELKCRRQKKPSQI